MGQLTDLGFETADIQVRAAKGEKPAQFITVRGISLEDILKLSRVHGPDMISLFDRLVKTDDVDLTQMASIVLAAVQQAPEVVADLIVLATDADDANAAHKVARRLPLPIQARALEEIARLTFEEHGGLGEFLETVTRMFSGVNGLLAKLRASEAGSLASGEQLAS